MHRREMPLAVGGSLSHGSIAGQETDCSSERRTRSRAEHGRSRLEGGKKERGEVVRDQTTIWELIKNHVNAEQEGWRLEADSCSKMQRAAKYQYFSTVAGWATGSVFVSYLAGQASRSKGRGVPSTRAHDALALHARLSWSLSAPVFDSPVALLGLCGVRFCCSRLQPMTS